MKIKREKVALLEVAFQGLIEEQLEPETSFKIAKNLIVASETVAAIKKTYVVKPEYTAYIEAMQEVIKGAGGIQKPDGSFELKPEQAMSIKDELDKLAEEHKDAIDAHNEYAETFKEFLDREIELEFTKIELKELTGKIKPKQILELVRAGILE